MDNYNGIRNEPGNAQWQGQGQVQDQTMDPQTSARWIAFYKAKAQKMKTWVIILAVGLPILGFILIAILSAIAIPAFSGINDAANSKIDSANQSMLKTAGAYYIAYNDSSGMSSYPAAGAVLTESQLSQYIDGGLIPYKSGTSTKWTVTVGYDGRTIEVK
ncbi:MAG: hypothetical protein WCQ41_05230 [Bacillota bacterium]